MWNLQITVLQDCVNSLTRVKRLLCDRLLQYNDDITNPPTPPTPTPEVHSHSF